MVRGSFFLFFSFFFFFPPKRHRLAARSVKLLEGFDMRVANGRPTGHYRKRTTAHGAQTAHFVARR